MLARLLPITLAVLLGACTTTPLLRSSGPAPATPAGAAPAPGASPAPAPGREVPAAADVPEVLRLNRPAGGEWLGLYLVGEKAGSIFAHTAEDELDGVPAIRAELALTLELAVGGNVARRVVIDKRWYERRNGGRLLGFEATREGDGGNRHVLGRCDVRGCQVSIRHDGGVDLRQIPLPPETADLADPVRLAAARRGSVEVVWLDLDELDLQRTRHRFGASEGGELRVLTREAGESFDLVTRLDERGATVEVELGPGLVARAEPESEARHLGRPAEIFALTSVPLPAPLPAAPARVIFEIEGLPEGLWRRDGRQHFEPLEGGAVRVTIDAVAVLPPAPAESPEAFLVTTPSIDWEHAGIRAIAAGLLAKEPRARAEALVADVHGRLEKVYGSSSDRASRVLAEGKGDCTEHALLFVALARAAGIPARRVHGLVHTDAGAGPALYWHEWAEIWLDGAWIAVDPTFGQFPADATHLSLGAGRSSASTRVLGQLRIRRATAPTGSSSFR